MDGLVAYDSSADEGDAAQAHAQAEAGGDALASARALLQIAPPDAPVETEQEAGAQLAARHKQEQDEQAAARAQRRAVATSYAMDRAVFEAQLREEERSHAQRERQGRARRAKRSGRKRPGTRESDAGSGTYLGPWAPPEEELEQEEEEEVEEEKEEEALEETKKQPTPQPPPAQTKKEQQEEEEESEKTEEPAGKRAREDASGGVAVVHLAKTCDYQGRSFVEPPRGVRAEAMGDHKCFIPKRCVATAAEAHRRGTACVRLVPRYGHLLLSGGLDGLAKLWTVAEDGALECAVTYHGHSKALRDVCFAGDGRRFVTCAYDRYVKLWDTETGKVVSACTNGHVPYCARLCPANENECLCGTSQRRVVQWDFREGKVVQEYEEHQANVNAVLFLDASRFVSSSDDKSLRVWDYGIPVPVRYISEPTMHSMPALCLHPSGKYFAAQSLDNKIVVYEATGTYRLLPRKRFTGHMSAGYACQLSFSPDGRYLVSGDESGKLWVWGWKSGRLLTTLPAHSGVAIGVEWHPLQPSRLVSCGWDGTIKSWD